MKILRGTGFELVLYGLFFLAWMVPESVYLRAGVVIRPLDIAAALLVGIAMLSQLARGKVWFYGDRAFVILGVLILWGAVSIIWAEHRGAVLPQIVQWAELFLLFAFLTTFLRSEAHLHQFIMTFLVLASVMQIVQGFQSVPVIAQLVPYERERPDPFFSAMVIVYLTACWIEGRVFLSRFAMGALILLAGINLVYSLTRKGIIGCIASLALLLLLSSASPGRLFRRAVILGGIAAGLFFVVSVGTPELSNRLKTRFAALTMQNDTPGGGVEGRLTHVAISYNILKDHPWVGLGLGNHHLVYKEYFTRIFAKARPDSTPGVHNGFLLVLGELGSVGLVLMLFLFLRPLRMMNLYRSQGHRLSEPWILLGSASLLPLIVLKFGTAHAGIGRIFPLIFLLVLVNAYGRFLTSGSEEDDVAVSPLMGEKT